MGLHPSFKLRERHTPELLELLDAAVLGTNGAHYRHLDTAEKLEEVDKPLHLTFERNNKPTGNVTFCRRDQHWYVRYFAFSSAFQSSGKKKSKVKQSGFLKKELNTFFENAFNGEHAETPVDSFYAYIDPNNEKSLWMSETFGFETIGKVATQTYSRIRPKPSERLVEINDVEEVRTMVEEKFSQYQFYFDAHIFNSPMYGLKDENGEIIAFAKMSKAEWEIKRLPRRMGRVLVKIIPFIPGLNKLIRPKCHSFLVPEAVIAKNNDPQLLDELFQAILNSQKEHLMIWWVDEKNHLYSTVKSKVKWGLLNKLIGVNQAHVVQRHNPTTKLSASNTPIYTSGIDFI
ncbi:MAG: hypothetical protein QNK23_17070 [Crocinitomicaceae bacterium]|nr:hypothetical protein [Crocinitomicaceae bacterium]